MDVAGRAPLAAAGSDFPATGASTTAGASDLPAGAAFAPAAVGLALFTSLCIQNIN